MSQQETETLLELKGKVFTRAMKFFYHQQTFVLFFRKKERKGIVNAIIIDAPHNSTFLFHPDGREKALTTTTMMDDDGDEDDLVNIA